MQRGATLLHALAGEVRCRFHPRPAVPRPAVLPQQGPAVPQQGPASSPVLPEELGAGATTTRRRRRDL